MNQPKSASKRSTEKWTAILKSLQLSGQSVKEFCAQEKIHQSQLYLWRKRLAPKQATQNSVSPFIELKATPIRQGNYSADIIIELGSDRKIIINSLPPISYLAELIRGL